MTERQRRGEELLAEVRTLKEELDQSVTSFFATLKVVMQRVLEITTEVTSLEKEK